MNWEQIAGNWKHLRGSVQRRWLQLTDEDIDAAAGDRDQLIVRIQERYEISREDAEDQVDRWVEKIGAII